MGVFDDYERAREERDREFFEARQRQRRIWQEQDRVRQEELEQSRREDAEERAADAKADALARQQLWELFVKAVSKPTSVKTSEIVVPLAPDRELAQIDAQNDARKTSLAPETSKTTYETSLASETSKTTPKRPKNVENDASETSFESKTTPESSENDAKTTPETSLAPKTSKTSETSKTTLKTSVLRPNCPNSQIPDICPIQRQTVQGARTSVFASESESSDPGTPRE